ncbi:hypothetical protein EMIHUDRAFT_217970 [Emiliania huxleyi CCMP1516]|uniref:Uncharacterized protein n=2 Tax=Emiliania huxleyi TaxID=2903 RepID=A0A0D3I9M2_EMIH1|nr:hypothetical protein EMIHUDRAFT_217970 [Emiliania huxleyi CCMP1516]EOD07957.1 hypothetical protein EMIHUDRAFT_217970 [Emiliania huxleyi CCMP1516]|eukprot:XP_005760386.1 hypothetical protein EMIHUDRAFT_217970 [Emiliania huxleyi CCMP1516]
MEGERHDTKRQGEADGERSREQTAPAGHLETFAKNASYMGGLREGWIEKHSNKEEATGGTGRGCRPELDSAIHEINAEMAELFGTAPGEDPPSQRDLPGLAQAASSHQSPHAPPGKSADLQSAALAALAAGMRDAAQAPGGGPVPLAAASPMPARAHTSSGAAVALHAKIVWATDELSRAAEPAKATELANLIGACARAASELGEPFAGRPPSQ